MNWFNRQTTGFRVGLAFFAAFLLVDLFLYLTAPDQTLSRQFYLYGRGRPPVVFTFGMVCGAGAVLLAQHFWGLCDRPNCFRTPDDDPPKPCSVKQKPP